MAENENVVKDLYNINYDTQGVICDSGKCCGFRYWIVSYGTHPCAYVENVIKKYQVDVNLIDDLFDVHGGLTFAGTHRFTDGAFVVGWDYAHAFDYMEMSGGHHIGFHKFTYEDIFGDIKSVCLTLKKLKEEEEKKNNGR